MKSLASDKIFTDSLSIDIPGRTRVFLFQFPCPLAALLLLPRAECQGPSPRGDVFPGSNNLRGQTTRAGFSLPSEGWRQEGGRGDKKGAFNTWEEAVLVQI